MFQTMEVRWFQPESIPPSVSTWFQQIHPKSFVEPGRVDHYLLVNDADSLGIKLRQGRIEVKQRCGEFGAIRLHRRVRGVVEQWQKWSFGLVGSGYDFSHQPVPAAGWVGVHKERWLLTFRLTHDRQVVPAKLDAPGPGCDLELSQVKAGSNVWWSLCFEAFGQQVASLEETLLCVASHVLERSDPPTLMEEASFGYPRWLSIMGRKNET